MRAKELLEDPIDDAEIPAILLRLAAQLLEKGKPTNGNELKDRGVDIKEAAARLGVSESWLYHNWKTLPFAFQQGRRVIFSELGIDRHMREKQVKNP